MCIRDSSYHNPDARAREWNGPGSLRQHGGFVLQLVHLCGRVIRRTKVLRDFLRHVGLLDEEVLFALLESFDDTNKILRVLVLICLLHLADDACLSGKQEPNEETDESKSQRCRLPRRPPSLLHFAFTAYLNAALSSDAGVVTDVFFSNEHVISN